MVVGRPEKDLSLRVLHAPVNVGNQPWTLSRQERALGVRSDVVVNYSTWLQYPADRVIGEVGNKSLSNRLSRTWTGLSAPFQYDVMHYYFGRSLLYWDDYGVDGGMPFMDLHLAKKLGKKIFFTLQGCDARLARESNQRNEYTPCQNGRCSAYQTCLNTLDNKRKYLIEKVLPLCDHVFFLNPELGHYVPNGAFLPYANVDVEKIEYAPTQHRKTPVILHAPSDPLVKGTAEITEAIRSLQSKFSFDFKLVQGIPHSEAMQLYQEADLVIDQTLAGWYGGFAVELMAMGKPVMCYIRESDLKFVPKEMVADMPILNISLENLKENIESFLVQREKWQMWGEASRKYALKWHNPRLIATSMVSLYRNPKQKFSLDL